MVREFLRSMCTSVATFQQKERLPLFFLGFVTFTTTFAIVTCLHILLKVCLPFNCVGF